MITRLQQDSAIRIIVDSRFPRVNYEIFGGTNPAAVLYARQEFIAANPATMQALVNAFYKTLRWIATATTDEIVDTVPAEYFLGERAIYVKALKANLLVYSRTGIITRQGMNSARLQRAPPSRHPRKSCHRGGRKDIRKIIDTRIGIVPIPVYVILVALLVGFTYTGDIKGEISIMIAVLVIGGFTCAEIGKRTPVLRNIGAAAIFATFVPSALAYYKLLPPQIEKSVIEFTKYTNFLYLFIACIIVGSILSMDRQVLVQGFLKIFVPLGVGSVLAGMVGTGVGVAMGMSAYHTFFFVVVPIMAGGVGEGAIPLSIGYSTLLNQAQGDLFAQVLPPVMMGSLTAILLAGTLNFVGKRYPNLTGEGRLQPGEHDEMDTARQGAEDETGAPIDVSTAPRPRVSRQ